MDDRYETITWRGHKFDRYTVAAIQKAENLYGAPLPAIMQGSYNRGGVSASSGTHDGGGAVDFAPGSAPQHLVRVLRMAGFAAWERKAIPGVWGHHVHAVQVGNDKLAPSAARQVEAYRSGRDGLRGNAIDRTWRPAQIEPFNYVTRVTRARDLLVEAMKVAKPARKAKIRAALALLPKR